MKYACLVYVEFPKLLALSPAEGQKLTDDSMENDAELTRRGHNIMAQALQEPSTAVTIRVRNGKMSSTDGPFAETKELIAGYWLWKVNSLQEAIEWVKKCPNPMNEDSDIEIRQVFAAEDFGAEFTPELREKEAELERLMASRV